MAKQLSPWCKQAKHRMIDLDLSVNEVAEKIGKTREYTSAILNGRVYSEGVVNDISDLLNISNDMCTLGNN